MTLYFFTFLLMLAYFELSITEKPIKEEVLIEKHVFVNYSKRAVPMINSTKPIVVTLKSILLDLTELHEAKDVLESTLYVGMEWRDEILAWNDTAFEEDGIIVDNDRIWLPDIVLLNGIGDSRMLTNIQPFVYITRYGDISWWAGGSLETKCTFDLSKFPFDTQKCIMEFEPWILQVDKMKYETRNGISILQHYHENGEWEIIEILDKAYPTYYGYGTVSRYEIHISLRRRYLYHVLNVILPVVILSLINVCAFIIPPSSGEKMTVCVSIFLSFAVYLTVINNDMPKTSLNVSVFGVFLCFQMFLSGTSIVLVSIILYIHHESSAGTCCSKENITELNVMVKENGHYHKESINKTKTLAKRLDRIFLIFYVIINILSFAVYTAVSLG